MTICIQKIIKLLPIKIEKWRELLFRVSKNLRLDLPSDLAKISGDPTDNFLWDNIAGSHGISSDSVVLD